MNIFKAYSSTEETNPHIHFCSLIATRVSISRYGVQHVSEQVLSYSLP